MKPRKIFSQLFITYFSISLIGLLILLVIARFAFQNFYFQETFTGLTQKARLIQDQVAEDLTSKKGSSLTQMIESFAKKSETRITVILPDGQVVADSAFDSQKMENHGQRTEIIKALKGQKGESLRFSDTLKKNLLYVAIPLNQNDELVGVLRLSISADRLYTSLFEITERIIIWSVILLLILSYLIYIQSEKVSAPLEEMRVQVETFSSGDFQSKIEIGEANTQEVASLFSSIQLMSERLHSQFQKINKQKNEQLAVFASMLEGVITIYPDMNIYHINKAALKLFNQDKNSVLKGTPLKEVVKSERIYKMAKKLLEDHQTVDNEFEYESGLILNVHGTILQSEVTGMLGAVLVFNDISKMRELENHRKQFVANVSHELKTPLTAIQGYLETIMEEEINDPKIMAKFLGIINRHTGRLKTIIEDLLSLSSIERESEVGGLDFQYEPIKPVLQNIISLCHEKAETKKIDVQLIGEDVTVWMNSALIEQAIINLLDNAIKYGPDNSDVVISIKKTDKLVQIKVSDQGQGIPPDHHERLFERFYSVDKARSRELGGSGLGLAIVKHIALSHRGNVWLESSIGEGASFIFEIPLHREEKDIV